MKNDTRCYPLRPHKHSNTYAPVFNTHKYGHTHWGQGVYTWNTKEFTNNIIRIYTFLCPAWISAVLSATSEFLKEHPTYVCLSPASLSPAMGAVLWMEPQHLGSSLGEHQCAQRHCPNKLEFSVDQVLLDSELKKAPLCQVRTAAAAATAAARGYMLTLPPLACIWELLHAWNSDILPKLWLLPIMSSSP